MAKVAFITGIGGQDGAYLSHFLLEKGYEVHGGDRRKSVVSTGRLRELNIEKEVRLHDFDLGEITNIQRVLEEIKPDEVYNLGAQSFVSASFEQPIYTADIDAIGPLRILEILRQMKSKARFYQASTSEMFGKVRTTPQDELTPFYPRSPYGVAKVFAHWATVNYRESYGMFNCSGILFNHESPLRGSDFVTRKITLGLAKVKHGKDEVLELGNIDSRRDWGFAGDYTAGMWAMLQADKPDDFVLATGETRTVRSFIETAASKIGMEIIWEGAQVDERGVDSRTGRTVVRISPKFYRPAEVDALVGSAAKAEKVLGWRPQVTFEELVSMMAEADERRVVDDRFLC